MFRKLREAIFIVLTDQSTILNFIAAMTLWLAMGILALLLITLCIEYPMFFAAMVVVVIVLWGIPGVVYWWNHRN